MLASEPQGLIDIDPLARDVEPTVDACRLRTRRQASAVRMRGDRTGVRSGVRVVGDDRGTVVSSWSAIIGEPRYGEHASRSSVRVGQRRRGWFGIARVRWAGMDVPLPCPQTTSTSRARELTR